MIYKFEVIDEETEEVLFMAESTSLERLEEQIGKYERTLND